MDRFLEAGEQSITQLNVTKNVLQVLCDFSFFVFFFYVCMVK